MKRHLIETVTLIAVAVTLALVANLLASRQRHLAVVDDYPNAQTVPARAPEPKPVIEEPEPVEPEPVEPTSTREQVLQRFPPTPDDVYLEITGDDVAWLWATGTLILDARRTAAYEKGHIMGARSFPVWESDINDRVSALFEEVGDQEMPIVIYCSGGNCEDSHMLADKLWGVFFSNVLVYKDGFPDWEARGGAIETGPEASE